MGIPGTVPDLWPFHSGFQHAPRFRRLGLLFVSGFRSSSLDLVKHGGEGCEVSPSGLFNKFLKQLDKRGHFGVASGLLFSEASRDSRPARSALKSIAAIYKPWLILVIDGVVGGVVTPSWSNEDKLLHHSALFGLSALRLCPICS